jgi:hypothetical protein
VPALVVILGRPSGLEGSDPRKVSINDDFTSPTRSIEDLARLRSVRISRAVVRGLLISVVLIWLVACDGMSTSTLPLITNLAPSSGAPGTEVTISGRNFGATQGASSVVIGGIAAAATNWAPTSVTVRVPNGVRTGNVIVTVGSHLSNGLLFVGTVAAKYPIKSSTNKRYLVDENNAPFLITGDAPHTMFANVSTADAEAYMTDRMAHGINTLWCELLVNDAIGGRKDGSTYDGILPFTGKLPGGLYDLTKPNPAYFDRVDAMINLAAKHSIVIMLDSLENDGWMSTFEANGNAAANTWGRYIGNRYRGFPNLIWMTGNDFQTWQTSSVDNTLTQSVMAGIAAIDPKHLQTTELNFNISGSLDDLLLVPYTNLAAAYTYYPTYFEVLQQYNNPVATLPVFMEEGYYEGQAYGNLTPKIATPLMLRKVPYWTVLSGGLGGYMFGTQYFDFHAGWQSGIASMPATQVGYFAAFFQSLPWYDLVPDQKHIIVTAGYGTTTGNGGGNIKTDDYVTTAYWPDGSGSVSYAPVSTTLTVALSQFSSAVYAKWYDPTNNTYSTVSGSPFKKTGTGSIHTPGRNSAGDSDWVLVLETNQSNP